MYQHRTSTATLRDDVKTKRMRVKEADLTSLSLCANRRTNPSITDIPINKSHSVWAIFEENDPESVVL